MNILKQIAFRLFLVLVFLTYPIFALLAFPWAWFASHGFGRTSTLDGWKEYWGIFRPSELRQFWSFLTAPFERA